MIHNKWYIKIWVKKKYLDCWSINHFLSGCILAAISSIIQLSLLKSAVIVLVLLIFYELFEISRKIREPIINRTFDVIVGMFGFSLVYRLTTENILDSKYFLIVAIPLGILLLSWGMWASKLKKQLHLDQKEP